MISDRRIAIRKKVSKSGLLEERSLYATWLLQYDALIDKEILSVISSWDEVHEMGLFLEVTPSLAQESRVIYPHAVPWDDPNAIFLSGYSQSDRRKLIDTQFEAYKSTFGEF